MLMKKCLHLVILGLAFSLPAMSQTVFSCGFEDGETGYELTAVKAVRGGVSDAMTIAEADPDDSDGHGYFLSPYGGYCVDGGQQYLVWQSAGIDGDAPCKADESFLTLKGLDLKDNTSYRCTFYIRTDAAGGKVQAGVYHGTQDKHVAVKTDWSTGTELVQELTDLKSAWTRVSFVFYYRSDSYYMESAGDLEDSNFIRFSFMGPARSYSIDEISVVEASSPAVYWDGNVVMVDFGYETNLFDLDAGTLESMKGSWFSLSGTSTWTGNQEENPLEACELDASNSRIMLFFAYPINDYQDAKLTFRNSDSSLPQLKYTDAGYPDPENAEWATSGKAIPDFECTDLKKSILTSVVPWTPTKVQPQAESDQPYEVRHVDMLGRQVSPEAPGLHIILQSDGTAKKVFTK